MALTNAQRQANWRRKRDIRATLFDHLNERRIAGLDFPIEDKSPEMAAIRQFFRNCPLCHFAPKKLVLIDGRFLLIFPPGTDLMCDEAVAAVAVMLEVTRLPVAVAVQDGEWVSSTYYTARIKRLIDEVVQPMRERGMWGGA